MNKAYIEAKEFLSKGRPNPVTGRPITSYYRILKDPAKPTNIILGLVWETEDINKPFIRKVVTLTPKTTIVHERITSGILSAWAGVESYGAEHRLVNATVRSRLTNRTYRGCYPMTFNADHSVVTSKLPEKRVNKSKNAKFLSDLTAAKKDLILKLKLGVFDLPSLFKDRYESSVDNIAKALLLAPSYDYTIYYPIIQNVMRRSYSLWRTDSSVEFEQTFLKTLSNVLATDSNSYREATGIISYKYKKKIL